MKIHTQRKFYAASQEQLRNFIERQDFYNTSKEQNSRKEKVFYAAAMASQNQPKYPQSKSRETTHIYSKSKCFMKLFKFSDHCRTKVSMIDEFNTNLKCKSLRIL